MFLKVSGHERGQNFAYFSVLPMAEILGHESLRTVSTLSLSCDKHSFTSIKERRGAAAGEGSEESQELERDWKI